MTATITCLPSQYGLPGWSAYPGRPLRLQPNRTTSDYGIPATDDAPLHLREGMTIIDGICWYVAYAPAGVDLRAAPIRRYPTGRGHTNVVTITITPTTNEE